ncbi:DUF86 domain-containing protein [Desulforhabdus sp. TSK]|uniref:type VII toxin-antitoxin system HepT family RNase toxin n=1 Tax=Desulforhabdus sp. TSK TaxID=2925014 RepID=UPI001FC7E696|nr:DUF86 domain-containing protein [Desulforhabdus sp. TSK]GKT08590.1 hypothetical protein DSTSK_18950 [Desulforhabdus sp. TSK]
MVNKRVLSSKSDAARRHVARIVEKRQVGLPVFLEDLDRQESILFNFQMAIQSCIDIASHVVAEEEFGIAGSTNELFYLLEENGIIPTALAERMVQAVGFRNLIVHEYGRVNLEIVYRAARENLDDLLEFMQVILGRFGQQ